MTSDLTIERVVEIVARHCPNPQAVAYARAFYCNREQGEAMGHSEREADKVQAIYILSNISHWRGVDAVMCRGFLKGFVK